MNRNQFILVLLALAIVGGAGLVLVKRNQETWTIHEAKAGDKALTDFPVNAVAAIHVKGALDFTIVHTNGLWCVPERYNYPANFSMISDFLLKIRDLKVIQSDVIGPSQFPRLNLNEPGSRTNAAILFEFKDDHGAVLASFLAGKKHDKPQNPNEPLGIHGFFDGRYILLPADPHNVLLVSDELAAAAPDPQSWLAHDFFKINDIKFISVAFPNAADSWEMSRDTSSSPWVLANAAPGEILNSNVCNNPGEVLAFPSFVDVLPKTPGNEANEGLDKPAVVTVLTDNLSYILKVGTKHTDGTYPITVSAAGNIPPARAASAGESPDEKATLDEEFENQARDLKQKIARIQPLTPWIYEVDHWIEMVIQKRSNLVVKPASGEQATAQ